MAVAGKTEVEPQRGEIVILAEKIQRAGKPAMDVADLLRGRPIPAGTKLA